MATTGYGESGLSVTVTNLKEVQDYIETMPEESFPAAKEEFRKTVLRIANVVKQMKKFKRQPTGYLKKSIHQGARGKDFDSLGASVWSATGYQGREVVYAPIHEFGGVIKAKNAYKNMPGGPFLNIPLEANRTPAGAMRFSAKTVFKEMGGYIRGHAVFVEDTAMFALVKSVKLKPRLGMRDAAEDEIPTLLSNLADVIGAEG